MFTRSKTSSSNSRCKRDSPKTPPAERRLPRRLLPPRRPRPRRVGEISPSGPPSTRGRRSSVGAAIVVRRPSRIRLTGRASLQIRLAAADSSSWSPHPDAPWAHHYVRERLRRGERGEAILRCASSRTQNACCDCVVCWRLIFER